MYHIKLCMYLVALLVLLLQTSCQRELYEGELQHSSSTRESSSAMSSVEGLKKSLQERASTLRNAFVDDSASISFEGLEALWDDARIVSLGDTAEIAWVPFSFTSRKILVHEELDSIAISKLGGVISQTYLIRWEDLSDPAKSQSFFVHLIPTPDYLYSGGVLDGGGKLVPESFDGELHLYSLDGKLLYREKYLKGEVQTDEIDGSLRKSVMVTICFTTHWDVYVGTGDHLEYKYSNQTKRCYTSWMPEYSPITEYLALASSQEYDGGGGGGSGSNGGENQHPLLKDPCGEAKKLLSKDSIAQKVSALIAHREKLKNLSQSEQYERGFVEKLDSTFVEMPIAKGSNGHSLDAGGIEKPFRGVLHAHTAYAEEGVSETAQIYSPADIDMFYIMLQGACSKKRYDLLQEVYSILVAEGATYIMRYTGDSTTIVNDMAVFNDSRARGKKLENKYVKKMKKATSGRTFEKFWKFARKNLSMPNVVIQRIDHSNPDRVSTRYMTLPKKKKRVIVSIDC